MATVRPRSGRWNVYWRMGGRGGTTQSLTFDDETDALEAQRIAQNHKHNISDTEVQAALLRIPVEVLIARREEDLRALHGVGMERVEDMVESYLDSLINAEPGTKKKYRQQLESVMLPAIGKKLAKSVTFNDINKILMSLRACDCVGSVLGSVCSRRRSNRKAGAEHKGGLDTRTVDRYFAAMKGFFQHLVKCGIRQDNPVKDTDYKAQTLARYNAEYKEDVHFYMTKDQYLILRGKFEPADQLLLDFLAGSGARIGEATCMRVGAIFPRGRQVMASIHAAVKSETKNKRVEGLPKSGAKRVIEIDGFLYVGLAPVLDGRMSNAYVFTSRYSKSAPLGYDEFRTRWDHATLAAVRCPDHPPAGRERSIGIQNLLGPRCGDNGQLKENGLACRQYVVPGFDRCTYHFGPEPEAESACECWDKRLPRRPTIHDLRHTHVAWMIAAGNVSVIVIKERLGHATVQTTETIYAGLLQETNDAVLAAVRLPTVSVQGEALPVSGLPSTPASPSKVQVVFAAG